MLSLNAIIAVCLSVFSLTSACKSSDEHAGPMPTPTKAAPADYPVDTGKRIIVPNDAGANEAKNGAKSKERPSLTDKDLKDLKRSLPALEGTRVLKALVATPRSRLARMALCSERAVAATTAAMVSALKRKKWAEVSVEAPSNNESHRSFSANLGRFRLNGTTTQGEFENCKKSLNQTRISWSFQERQPPAATSPAGAETGDKTSPTDASTIDKAKRVPSLNAKEAVRLNPAKRKKLEPKSELR